MKYKLVYLEWGDALYTSSWVSKRHIKEWADSSDWIVKHVGWIIKETSKYIVISSRLSLKDDSNGDEFGALQKIPKTWIRKRKTLKL